MNETSPILLVGVGTAGAAMAHGVMRAFAGDMRCLVADTDASSARPSAPFHLLGGDRLAGHGSGGDVVQARLAAEDSLKNIDEHLEGVRFAVVVAALGGGTGGGATVEIAKRIEDRGVPTLVFATLPFSFEGDERSRRARGVTSMIDEAASATIFIPLDKLVGDTDNMDEAMRRASGALASAVSLFWRLLEKPGYIRLDAERMRRIVSRAGRGRFAVVTTQGPDRAAAAVEALTSSPLLSGAMSPVGSVLCGVLAGEDLRLSEVGYIADGVRNAFGRRASFDLATVNDEATFAGRLSVVVMVFESAAGAAAEEEKAGESPSRKQRRGRNPLSLGPQGRGRFNNVEPTVWNGQDIDTPTFIRRNVSLDA